MSLKIAFIGAGSIGFTRTLVHDLLVVPQFQDAEFALHDIDKRNLDMIARLLERDVRANGLKAQVTSSLDRREVLTDADYVINSARVGGLEAFELDIDIPLTYGVDQCVGDTLSAGGIMYGQRGIPSVLDWCEDILEVSKPEAIMLSYGNPNAMLTWAANHYGGVPTIGLCHGVQGGHWQICNVIELLVNKRRKPGSRNYEKVEMKDVDIICAGINHQTWYIQVIYKGEDWCSRLLEGFEKHPEYSKTEKVRIDVLRNFGYYSTESNGHLSEYLPWYRKRPEEVANWIDVGSWINGETGGYLRICSEGRNWFETEFPKLLAEEPWKLSEHKRSSEHGAYIIEGLETGKCYRGHFNVVNDGCITNLPDDCIVEVPGYVDSNGVNIPMLGDLPDGCAAICSQSVNVQRLAVEAAVHGDVALLKQAMMLDPLVGAVCTTPEISQMTDAMLVAQSKWLPQYKNIIASTKRRLSREPSLARFDTTGTCRKEHADAKTVAKRNAATAKKRKSGKALDIAEPEG
ncbi:MAG: alpha-glucosidase/alpha-galactosidase [Lentisphaerae bacterium]|jgi:alpha-galactosidase|nr:alpha-glucosidase/alpha-galactosidase [Lentisphaerota bacterium]